MCARDVRGDDLGEWGEGVKGVGVAVLDVDVGVDVLAVAVVSS